MIKSARWPSLPTQFSRKNRTLGTSILAFVLPIGLWAQNPAGFLVGNPDESQILVSPGQVTTLILTGVQTVLPADSSDIAASTLPLPLSLAGFSAVIRQLPGAYIASLPIFRVRQTSIETSTCQSQQRIPACMITTLTVQIPPDILLKPVEGPSRLTIIDVSDNGRIFSSSTFAVTSVATTVHILNTCDSLHVGFGVNCNPFITHADGTLAGPFFGTPAQPGETLVVYAVGLGSTTPVVPAGTPSPNPPAVATRHFSLILNYGCATKRTVTPDFVGLTPGLVGLYQVNFVVPEPVVCSPPSAFNFSGGNLTLLSDDWVSSSTVWLFSH